MRWDTGIAGVHKDIAASPKKMIGVLAGPGTGKTSYGLMRRVARLLDEGVPGSRIMLVSFTRTAAHDLRDKVAALGVPGADEVRATTLHSYCFGLLQRDAVLAITHRVPRPLLAHETDVMLRDLSGDFGDIRARRRLLAAFEAGWARGVEDHPGLATLPEDKAFKNEVMRWLRHHKAILIGEVVPLTYRYLATNPLAEDLERFDHIVVDEYQDLNVLEQRLLDLLTERADASLCVAGDDDQSIYGFRHAHPAGIHEYLGRNGVERHEIAVCGRCPRIVLSMANALMDHAPGREKPSLTCLQEGDGEVAIVQWPDLADEIEGTVAAIVADVQSGRRQPGDILVLTHRRRIGEALRDRLRDLEVPAHSFFTEEAVASVEAQEALALLRLVVSDDPVSLRVILGLGDANRRAEAYRRLSEYSAAERLTEREALDQARGGEKLPVGVRALLSRYDHALNVIASLPRDNLQALVDQLLPPDQQATSELRSLALEALPDADTAQDLLEALIVKITQADIPPSPDYVRIMSLHKSKGLTSPSVFVAGLVEGIVPTLVSGLTEAEREQAITEQRRLFYVAITRAAEQLALSYSASMELAVASGMGVHVVREKIRRVGGELRAPTIASRYLSELGPEAPMPIRGTDWLAQYASL